ncbi:MAG: glycosyltransferase [Bryobacteraceae bacterium]
MGERIVTVSDYDRALCLGYHLTVPRKVVTIRNGVADSPLRALPGAAAEPVVSMVARFDEPKDHLTLLRAAADIPEAFGLRLIGDGPRLGFAQRAAHELGLGRKVDFLGSRSDVPDLLSGSHIFVLASKWEALPLCVLEAMRAGLPVVASDVGGVGEALQEGVTGFLVKSGSVAALSGKLRTLIRNPGLRARMGAQGRRQYLAAFTVESMLAKTRGLYREVLEQARKRQLHDQDVQSVCLE